YRKTRPGNASPVLVAGGTRVHADRLCGRPPGSFHASGKGSVSPFLGSGVPAFGLTSGFCRLGHWQCSSVSRLDVIVQFSFAKVDGLDGQTGIVEHLDNLLPQVFGLGAGLCLGQLLPQSKRVIFGSDDLLATLFRRGWTAASKDKSDNHTGEQKRSSFHSSS